MLYYVWNTIWPDMSNVKLIACGSAASWMLDKLINAKGGLHNPLTAIIKLNPFTLAKTKLFLQKRVHVIEIAICSKFVGIRTTKDTTTSRLPQNHNYSI